MIAAYAISRNEEKSILKFLNNIKNFDAVYVLDTGSTDNTVKLLEEAGVNVIVKTYENFDFAQARNDCLDLIPKEYEWCISFDFNENVDDFNIEMLKNTKADAFYSRCFTFNHDERKYIEIERKIRIHKNKKFKWYRALHEELIYEDDVSIELDDYTKFYKYSVMTEEKLNFYFDICLREYIKNPTDIIYIWFLLDYYYNKNMWEETIEIGTKYLNYTLPYKEPFRIKAFILISKSLNKLNLREKAIESAIHSLSEAIICQKEYPFWIRDSLLNLTELGIKITDEKSIRERDI